MMKYGEDKQIILAEILLGQWTGIEFKWEWHRSWARSYQSV